MIRIVLALFLVAHGIAHLVGFVVPWKIATMKEMPYKTTILSGSIDLGDVGIRVMGILWLIATLAFIVSGIGVLTRVPWWLPATMIVTVSSLFLCIIGWPDSRIGVFINVVIVAFLLVGQKMDWVS